jgi:hypothetical protein
VNSPPETTDVELIVVTGFVIITGGFDKGVDCISEAFLQLKTNPKAKVEAAIVKMLIGFMQRVFIQDKIILIDYY